jgi:hypothetical protein
VLSAGIYDVKGVLIVKAEKERAILPKNDRQLLLFHQSQFIRYLLTNQ